MQEDNLIIESQEVSTITFEVNGTISNSGIITINWTATEGTSNWEGTAIYTPK